MPTITTVNQKFGDYLLQGKLGEAGMGVVFLAYDTLLDRKVALKVPRFGEALNGDEVRARFIREAKAAAKLDHPNICPIHAVGQIGDLPYFTMPYLEGETLSKLLLREREGLDQREAVDLVYRLAEALEVAHNAGVIHRDLKPANILMKAKGEPVIMDFGVARLLDPQTELTRTGTPMGTPSYMPPEQVTNAKGAGPAADVYSLGVILYQLLTGKPPFTGATVSEVLVKQLEAEPRPP